VESHVARVRGGVAHLRAGHPPGALELLGFQARPTERLGEVRAAGAPPIVVVGTTRDPATPMKWAEALADQLESGVLVRATATATPATTRQRLRRRAVESYLIDGTVPTDGLCC
jgi:hypothetical protein